MEVTVQCGQTLSDIAVQVYGDLRAVCDVACANGMSMTAALVPGTVLVCPDIVYDLYIQDYVRKRGIMPATAIGSKEDIWTSAFTEHFSEEFR